MWFGGLHGLELAMHVGCGFCDCACCVFEVVDNNDLGIDLRSLEVYIILVNHHAYSVNSMTIIICQESLGLGLAAQIRLSWHKGMHSHIFVIRISPPFQTNRFRVIRERHKERRTSPE